jgi:hypothetical protein
VQDIDKMNKKLKKGGADSSLNNRRIVFERVRALWNDKRGVWCAIDVEAWEKDHTVLTEFGWSLARWQGDEMERERGHFIVKEHKYYTNGQYVTENRMVCFAIAIRSAVTNPSQCSTTSLGSRRHLPRQTSRAVFVTSWNHYQSTMGQNQSRSTALFSLSSTMRAETSSNQFVFFILPTWHNHAARYLRSKGIEAPLEGLSYILPESCQQSGLFVVDTTDLFGALMGDSNDRRSLERMGNQLGLAPTHLHNAGNDAHYTILALRAMADDGPLDMQREKRWPKKVEGIKVVQNEDSDSDSDGGFGFGPVDFKTGEVDPERPAMRPPKAENITEPDIQPVPSEANLFDAAPVIADGLPPAVAVTA